VTPRVFRRFHPILFQGLHGRGSYFEGWYFKQTCGTDARKRAFAFIPGISRSSEGNRAFIQTIDGATGRTRYFSFPSEEFRFTDQPFEVRIGPNRFSLEGLTVDVVDEDGRIEADLSFQDTTPPQASMLSPGVMGPYSFAPFMECYHGIASMNHLVNGLIRLDKTQTLSFENGNGYIEKDWGRSMPSSWIWIQSNDFDPKLGPASLSFSLARVPWMGGSFNGFICLFWARGTEFRFASYTGATVSLLEKNEESLRVLVGDKIYKMELQVRGQLAKENPETSDPLRGSLAAPQEGAMSRRIIENMDNRVRVILKRRHGSTEDIIFDGTSSPAAVEVTGDVSELIR
jgi:hypothetical protein